MNHKLLIAIILPVLLFSCEEKTAQEVNIYIQNNTGSKLEVILTPANAYRGMIGYRFSSAGGGYRSNVFTIDTCSSELLFSNAGIAESAGQVTRKAFDEILIIMQDADNTRLLFSPVSVVNYKSNIFSDDAIWTFEKHTTSRPTQFRKNLVECNDYFFSINQESITLPE